MGFCEFVRALLNFGDCPRRNGYFPIFLPCFYEGAFVLAGKEGKLPLLPKAGCASSLPLGASAKKKAVAWGNSLLCMRPVFPSFGASQIPSRAGAASVIF